MSSSNSSSSKISSLSSTFCSSSLISSSGSGSGCLNKFLLGNSAFGLFLRNDRSGLDVVLVVDLLVVVVSLPRGVTALLDEAVVDLGVIAVPGCLGTGGRLNLRRGLFVVLAGASETSSNASVAFSSC